MNKDILSDYIDACELVKETESDIKKLQKKRKTVAQINVKGSNPEWPYQEQHFHIEGTAFTYEDDWKLRMEERFLEEQKENAEKLKLDVEAWMINIPNRMQRIIRYRFFDGESWENVADRLGRKANGESVRKEYERFMGEN